MRFGRSGVEQSASVVPRTAISACPDAPSSSLEQHLAVSSRHRGRESSSPEARQAWRRYLRATRVGPDEEYEQTEEAAWRQLMDELASVDDLDSGAARHPLARSQRR